MVYHLDVGLVAADLSLQSSGDMRTVLGVMSEVVFSCSQLRVEVVVELEHMLVGVLQLLDLYLVVVVVVQSVHQSWV